MVDSEALPGEVVAHHEFGTSEGLQVTLHGLQGMVRVQEDGVHLVQ